MSRKATAAIYGDNDRVVTTYDIPIGAELHVAENEQIGQGQRICSWNPYSIPILSNASGWVHIEDVVEGITARTDKGINGETYVRILKTSGYLDPRILVKDRSGKVLDCHYLYLDASCDLVTNQFVNEGEILASYPRVDESHFLGGMSHAVELLKGKGPPEASTLAQCDGEVKVSAERIFGKRLIIVRTKNGKEVPHLLSRVSRMQIVSKDQVFVGDPLSVGPLDPNEVLSIMGVEAAQHALLEGLRRHFSLQPQHVGSQHLEMVVAQMMRWLQIDDPGDGELSPGDLIDRIEFNKINQALRSSVRVIDPGDSEFRVGDIVTAELFKETNRVLSDSNGQTAKKVNAYPATGHVRILGIDDVAKQLDAMKFHRAIGKRPYRSSTAVRFRKSDE